MTKFVGMTLNLLGAKRRAYMRQYNRRRKLEDPRYAEACRASIRKYQRRRQATDSEYRANNAAQAKAWREANPEKLRAWYEANGKAKRKKWREWAAKNDRTEYSRAYREANKHRRYDAPSQSPEARRAWWQSYKERFPDKVKEMRRNWRRKNPVALRLHSGRRREWKKSDNPPTKNDIGRLFDEQGGLCFWTGDPLGDKYEIDHIVPLSRGGTHTPDNIALATPAANRSKGSLMPLEFWVKTWGVA